MTELLAPLLLPIQLAATLFMTGVIWFVQVVHYPLFASAGAAEFPTYEQRNTFLTTFVVGPAMALEALTAALLCWLRPEGAPAWIPTAGLALVAVNGLSTALLQMPCHEALSRGFDAAVHRRLLRTNWIRTAAWSLRGLLVLGMS